MTRYYRRLAVLVCLSALLPAMAESVPKNAPPGTICVTPQGWCHAIRPGPSGAKCACQTPYGWVQGTLN